MTQIGTCSGLTDRGDPVSDILDEPVTPSAFELSDTCQTAVGLILRTPLHAWPDMTSIAKLFEQVPPPGTYRDAFHAAGVLYRFEERAAKEIHRCVHGGTIPGACSFDTARFARFASVDQAHPEQWNAASEFAAWSNAFMCGLAAHHRRSIADRAIERLRARTGMIVKVSELAREVGCSVPVLCRRFRHATGKSVRQYAIKLRVDCAIDLLRTTDWKVEAIANEVGWKSKKDLHCAFARQLGATPASIRRSAAPEVAGQSESSLTYETADEKRVDGDATPEPEVFRLVFDSRPAAPERGEDAVMRKGLADHLSQATRKEYLRCGRRIISS